MMAAGSRSRSSGAKKQDDYNGYDEGVVDSTPKPEAGDQKDKTCWQCGRTFVTAMEVCPDDGARLIETDLDDDGDPLVGTIFDGRFQIQKKLGEGGMGTVYSARRLDFETDVALKLLKLDFARDDGIRKRFMYEARVISNLKHPHAVQLYDFGQTSEGHVYMVMELLDGESLADRLSYRFVTYREVFDVIPPVCGVLGEAHIRDVIHRDLKPENIYLLEVDGNEEFPKLLDFGIAKHKREETMTKSGTLWGTPAYMSPEQAEGDAVGPRADIYGIGIMIFELISGNLPFHASTQMGYAVKHINEPVRPLSSIPGLDSVPPALDEFVVQMLAKDPEDRPESMDAVATTLNRIRDEYFDDELLDSVPAEEVDPIGLQRWMKEAPDSFDDIEVPKAAVGETELAETTPGEAKVEISEAAAANGDGLSSPDGGQPRDQSQMETLAAPDSDAVLVPREGYGETKQADDEELASLRKRAVAEKETAWTMNPWLGGAIVVCAGVVLAGVFLLIDFERDTGEKRAVAPVERSVDRDEVMGTSEMPADASNVVAVGASRAMAVVFEAYGIIQHIEPGKGIDEPDFEFLHEPSTGEEPEGDSEEEELDELREALEKTF